MKGLEKDDFGGIGRGGGIGRSASASLIGVRLARQQLILRSQGSKVDPLSGSHTKIGATDKFCDYV